MVTQTIPLLQIRMRMILPHQEQFQFLLVLKVNIVDDRVYLRAIKIDTLL